MSAPAEPRRKVQYASFDEVLLDAERAVARNASTSGAWSLGQILDHLAIALEQSVDGFDFEVPWPIRTVGRLVFKRRIIEQGMRPGFRLPPNAAKVLEPSAVDAQAGLEHLRRAIARFQSETRPSEHPFLGPLTFDESNRIQLRHAELHLGFVRPA